MNKLIASLILLSTITVVYSQTFACQAVIDLPVCSWIAYESWINTASDVDTVDSNIGTLRDSISADDACKQAYTDYLCAQAFPKCSKARDSAQLVCKDTCDTLLAKCPEDALSGSERIDCTGLPTADCTNSSSILYLSSFVLMTISAFFL